MQKFTEFLEKNVEWLALGFGGLFLLYMVYAYVLTSPVSVEIGGQSLSLGEIDRYILNNQARALERAMDPNVPPPDLSFQSLTGNFEQRMKEMQPTVLANHWPMFPPQGLDIRLDDQRELEVPKVAQLPTLPAPRLVMREINGELTDEPAIRKGNSSVALPPPPVAGAPGTGPQLRIDQQRITGPAVIQVQVGRDGAFRREDRLWVSMAFRVSMSDVAAAFAKEKVFEAAPGSQTAFLTVEAEREERLPNGEWGNRVPVPLLQNAVRPPPLPEEVFTREEVAFVNQHVAWAAQNAVEILKPAFYPVLAGADWVKPDESDLVLAAETEQEMRERLQRQREEMEALREQRRRDAERARQQRPQRSSERSTGTGTRRGTRSRDDMDDWAPVDPDRPSREAEVRFEQARRTPPRRTPRSPQDDMIDITPVPPDEYMDDYADDYYDDPMVGRPGGRVAQEIPVQVTQKFQPTAEIGDVEMWVHDDTVQAGATYRYRVRYRMVNPILGWFGVADPPELQNKVYISSAWSEWTPPVRMDSLVQFFVAGTGLGAQQTVRFDVFKWEGGFWQNQTFSNLGPGDMIGEVRDNIDFSTGMTIVDIRTDARREAHVVLVDSEGTVIRRHLRTDQNSPEYRELLRKAQEDRQRQAALAPAADTSRMR